MEKKLANLEAILRVRKADPKTFLDGVAGNTVEEKIKNLKTKFELSDSLKTKFVEASKSLVEISPVVEETVETPIKPKKKKKDVEQEFLEHIVGEGVEEKPETD